MLQIDFGRRGPSSTCWTIESPLPVLAAPLTVDRLETDLEPHRPATITTNS